MKCRCLRAYAGMRAGVRVLVSCQAHCAPVCFACVCARVLPACLRNKVLVGPHVGLRSLGGHRRGPAGRLNGRSGAIWAFALGLPLRVCEGAWMTKMGGERGCGLGTRGSQNRSLTRLGSEPSVWSVLASGFASPTSEHASLAGVLLSLMYVGGCSRVGAGALLVGPAPWFASMGDMRAFANNPRLESRISGGQRSCRR